MSNEGSSFGRVVFTEDTRVLATEIFKFVVSVCDQHHLKKGWFIFDTKKFPTLRIVKKFEQLDLFILTTLMDHMLTPDKKRIKVQNVKLGAAGVSRKENFRPFIKLYLPNNFDPTIPMHQRIAENTYFKKNIWQVILHELVHQNDIKAIDLMISKKRRSQLGAHDEIEHEANLTSLINSCSQKEIEKFLKDPSLKDLPWGIEANLRLKMFVEENIKTPEKKQNLLRALNAIKVSNRVNMPDES